MKSVDISSAGAISSKSLGTVLYLLVFGLHACMPDMPCTGCEDLPEVQAKKTFHVLAPSCILPKGALNATPAVLFVWLSQG